jgi:hypothetical protein
MDIKHLLEKMQQFAGEPEQESGDQVRGTDVSKTAGTGKKHQFLHQLVGEIKKPNLERQLRKEFMEFDSSQTNPIDTVKLDVPLFIRLLEYAREDAKNDMDLHVVADRAIKLSQSGKTLNMDDYDSIAGQQKEEVTGQTPQTPQGGLAQQKKPTPQELQQAEQEKQNLVKNLSQLKSAGVDIDPAKASQTLAKTDVNQPLTAMDKDEVAKMAPAIGNIVANPQLAGQFKALIQKAQQG